MGEKHNWRETIRIAYILVEGQTEERFIKDVLSEYLKIFEVTIVPTIIKTSKFGRGGIRSFGQVENDLRKLLKNSSAHIITTMFDYKDLPEDFPGVYSCKHTDLYKRVECLERETENRINDRRFIAYFQLQEFEALLLSEVECFSEVFTDKRSIQTLRDKVNEYESPEGIPNPSELISDIIKGYKKTVHGPMIAKCVKVERMQEKCQHFREWIEKLIKKT